MIKLIRAMFFLVAFAAILYNPSQGLAKTSFAPSLGAASGFAALAGGPADGAVTCTGSTVDGVVGVVDPGTFTNTLCTTGTVNTDATAAYADFLFAYDSFPSISCDEELDGNLAGLTLKPGVYCVTAASTTTNGTLTLKGPENGIWIFKIGTGGTGALTGTGLNVVMDGGGDPCNVYWWVAQAATLNNSNFQGTILAGADITVNYSVLNGGALAGGGGSTSVPTGAVTFNYSIVTACETDGGGNAHGKCNQGVGNGPEGCDPGNSNNHNPSNDEPSVTTTPGPGNPGRKPGNR